MSDGKDKEIIAACKKCGRPFSFNKEFFSSFQLKNKNVAWENESNKDNKMKVVGELEEEGVFMRLNPDGTQHVCKIKTLADVYELLEKSFDMMIQRMDKLSGLVENSNQLLIDIKKLSK